MTFLEKYGPWAVVAGASEGMGAQFAHQLAAQGFKLLLVARRAEALAEVKAALGASTQVETLALDLGAPDAPARIAQATAALDVGLLVYNAARAPVGPFLQQTVEDNLLAIDVNVRAPMALAHHFATRFCVRRRGGIVLLSSLTAFQGSPFVSTYGATKAWNLALAEGLWFELTGKGVDVMAVCAGATRTPNFLKSAPDGAPGMLQPEQVVREALRQLGKGPLMIPGRFNRFASFLMRHFFPRRLTIAIMGNETRKLQEKRQCSPSCWYRSRSTPSPTGRRSRSATASPSRAARSRRRPSWSSASPPTPRARPSRSARRRSAPGPSTPRSPI
jgi:hypothetical protein